MNVVEVFMRAVPVFFLIVITSLFGCTKSDSASPDGGADAAVPVCGNQMREGTEECDDGNDVDTDVCANDCTFSPVCGDGTKQGLEDCDDGNNHSGDGCSGACLAEGCGNMRLDPGEVCDGTPGCVDCMSVTSCGDGTPDAGEQCDDGNTAPWDGCSASCELERAAAISEIDLLRDGPCDLNGDGYPDSSLGISLGLAWSQLATQATTFLRTSPFSVLVLSGVENPAFDTDDANVRLAWVRGADANGGAADFDGTGTVTVDPTSLSGSDPLLSFAGSISALAVNAGPEDITLPFLSGIEVGLRRARVVDTTLTIAGTAPNTTVSVGTFAGTVCGAVEVAPFTAIPNLIGMLGVANIPTASCDQAAVPDASVNLADLIVGGVLVENFLPAIVAVQPDVDLDGDGLEQYTIAEGIDCQAVIVSCTDGDGTVIDGHGCVTDPRMKDAISAAFAFTAPTTTFVP